MNLRTLFKTAGLALALSGIAHASDLTWTDEFSGGPLAKLGFSPYNNGSWGWVQSYSNIFDITTDGFNPLTMTIDSAVASFAFADDQSDGEEWVKITLDINQLFLQQEVNGSHPYSSYAWYSDDLSIGLLANLQLDGKLDFTVQIVNTVDGKYEDTYLKVAKLVAKGHENPTHKVPDEANTVILMGAAMLSLVALRKRLIRCA